MGLQDVNEVLQEVITGGTLHFDHVWAESSAVERLVLTAMARLITNEGGVASWAETEHLLSRYDLRLSRNDLLGAVRALITRDLVMADEDVRQLEFKIDLLRMWLLRYQRFAVIAEGYQASLTELNISPNIRESYGEDREPV